MYTTSNTHKYCFLLPTYHVPTILLIPKSTLQFIPLNYTHYNSDAPEKPLKKLFLLLQNNRTVHSYRIV